MIKRLILLILITAPLAAQGNRDYYNGEEGKITVYASGPEEMLRLLEKDFENDKGDVLDLVLMGGGPLRQRIWTEMQSGQIQADLFWGSDPLIYNALDDAGALDPYKPDGLDQLKSGFLTDHNYILVHERYGVVIYNSDKLKGDDVPKSYRDLLNPSLKHLVIQADPAQSSTALAITASLWSLYDQSWDIYSALIQKQELMLSKKNSDVPSRIQEGEFLVGIAPHDSVLRLKNKAKKEGYPMPLAICWPEEGALAIARPIAISRNPARPERNIQLTHDFVDFLLSPEAQKITTRFGFISCRKDLDLPKGVPEDSVIARQNWDMLADRQKEIQQGFDDIFE